MLIKTYDERETDLARLYGLLAAAKDPEKRKAVNREIKKLEFALSTAKASLDELAEHFADETDIHLIQDLDLNVDGKTVHIDHLLVNRYLDVHVLDTKHFSDGLTVTEDEQFYAWYKGKTHDIQSPLERNESSIAVLMDAMRFVEIPTKFRMSVMPAFYSAILVSNRATLEQPELGAANTYKTDQFASLLVKEGESTGMLRSLRVLPRLVSRQDLNDFARQISALHRPPVVDWRQALGFER